MVHISTEERRRRIGRRHALAAPASDLPTLARAMVGLHTSDPTTPFLAARARIPGITVADIEHELFDVRSVVRMVGMRRTIFVIPPDVIPLFDAGCNRKNTVAQQKRLVRMIEEQGIARDGTAWLEKVGAAAVAVLEEMGPAPGRELMSLIPGFDERLHFGGDTKWAASVSAGTRVLFILASAGEVVRSRPLGSWVSGQYRWASLRDWVGRPIERIETADAQAALLEGWLATYGPGTLRDLQWWSGWTKTDTTRALDALDAQVVELDDGAEGYVLLGDVEATPQSPPQAWLLPGLDPTVMGWKERDWFLGGHDAELFDSNGNGGPTVWWGGRIVGGWGQPESGEVRYELVESLPADAIDAIDAEAAAVETWLGGTRVMPRFPAPLDKRISKGA